jgi:predicted RecB family nuclease
MRIASSLFQAYLKCPTKCFLQLIGESPVENVYAKWEKSTAEAYRNKEILRLISKLSPNYLNVSSGVEGLKSGEWHFAVNFVAYTQDLEANIHAVERIGSKGRRKIAQLTPIRFIWTSKLNKVDKLLLGFDAIVLSQVLRRKVEVGKIIYGDDRSTLKVKTSALAGEVRRLTAKIAQLLANPSAPELILNSHCPECEFQGRCRQKAIERDDLSLLYSMSQKERKKLVAKGIFTVTQLSYTFRPRRRPKRLRDKREKYHHSLRALAIREKKIHVIGSPELKIEGTPVYFDVEGLPDRDFYYLIGVRIGNGDLSVQHSLWADNKEDERRIWSEFLAVLNRIDNPVLIHYGSYETTFLKRMCVRYGEPTEVSSATKAIASAVNLLSVLFAQVYFPTYGNGLKEVANYLGHEWSEIGASGLHCIMWRHQWQQVRDASQKERVIGYNTQDCEALALVTRMVVRLVAYNSGDRTFENNDTSIVLADSVEAKKNSKWGAFASPVSGFEYVNSTAHWDYQRDRIYARTNGIARNPARPIFLRNRPRRVDKVVIWRVPARCPQCRKNYRKKGPVLSRTLQDILFGRFSIKRRIVKFLFQTYRCRACSTVFGIPERYRICHKHSWDLIAYFLYHVVEMCIPQLTVAKCFNRLLGFGMHRSTLHNMKTKAAGYYEETKQTILDRIVRGGLVHADETRANIKGKSAFVWVLTSMREVVYISAESREGEIVQELLATFKGVLVSDFYTAYDSIACPQQKCLIHLMRDLNDDVLTNPFDEELKQMVGAFGRLLQTIVETVDRYGLKKRFLKKHIARVDRFFKDICGRDYKSETALKCRQRFEKNRDMLFTFLKHDGVPWNNNNAEHAIKAFARLREIIAGSSTLKGIDEYLTLLSVCQTCKYQGLDFLDFMRSGEKDIAVFAESKRRKGRNSIPETEIPTHERT